MQAKESVMGIFSKWTVSKCVCVFAYVLYFLFRFFNLCICTTAKVTDANEAARSTIFLRMILPKPQDTRRSKKIHEATRSIHGLGGAGGALIR